MHQPLEAIILMQPFPSLSGFSFCINGDYGNHEYNYPNSWVIMMPMMMMMIMMMMPMMTMIMMTIGKEQAMSIGHDIVTLD